MRRRVRGGAFGDTIAGEAAGGASPAVNPLRWPDRVVGSGGRRRVHGAQCPTRNMHVGRVRSPHQRGHESRETPARGGPVIVRLILSPFGRGQWAWMGLRYVAPGEEIRQACDLPSRSVPDALWDAAERFPTAWCLEVWLHDLCMGTYSVEEVRADAPALASAWQARYARLCGSPTDRTPG